MIKQEVLNEFREAKALLEGHFLLSSGLHSEMYLQCARVLMNPVRASRLCKALADKISAVIEAKAPNFVIRFISNIDFCSNLGFNPCKISLQLILLGL